MSAVHIGWPQGIMIGLVLLGLLHAAAEHGKPKKPPYDIYNFPLSLMRGVILFTLLAWGGFFA